jgi:predicted component of type VI protein secretion system
MGGRSSVRPAMTPILPRAGADHIRTAEARQGRGAVAPPAMRALGSEPPGRNGAQARPRRSARDAGVRLTEKGTPC